MASTSTEPENVAVPEEEEFVDVVEKSIGAFGWWQFLVCFASFIIKVPVGWHQLAIIFLAANVTFTCENDTKLNHCPCDKYVYNRSVFNETIATQWNLVCDEAFWQPLAHAIAMFGIMVGNLLFGYISDRFGRKNLLMMAVLLQAVAGVLVAVSPYFTMFLVFRFIVAVATGGTMVVSFVLIMEMIGTKWRTMVAILYQIPFTIAHLMLALISYLLRDWRYMQLTISIYSFFLIFCYWILPKSPRWLLSNRKKEEAIVELEKAAAFNKLPTENIRRNVDVYMDRYKELKKNSHGNFLDMVRTPVMRLYTMCMAYNWLVCGFCFYGSTQYVDNLSEDIFVNVACSALTQFPGILFAIWSVDFWGRKATLISSNLLAACSIFMTMFVPPDPRWIRILFACLDMFGLTIAFCTVYIYSAELFPTPIRNVGVGTSSVCARWGSMLAPFVLQMRISWLSSILFTILPLVAASMCMKLPETVGCKLPENIEEAEEFNRNPMKRRRRRGKRRKKKELSNNS